MMRNCVSQDYKVLSELPEVTATTTVLAVSAPADTYLLRGK
jgi:hypothetical protein